jgi:hypothetical protein
MLGTKSPGRYVDVDGVKRLADLNLQVNAVFNGSTDAVLHVDGAKRHDCDYHYHQLICIILPTLH